MNRTVRFKSPQLMTEQRLSAYLSQMSRTRTFGSKHANGTDTSFRCKPGEFGHTPYDASKGAYRDIWCKAMPIRANSTKGTRKCKTRHSTQSWKTASQAAKRSKWCQTHASVPKRTLMPKRNTSPYMWM